ncbi:plant self-incompatibility S1 [Artemisia annua]|uniref:Plant self-incompatibility S1 n=1 Tax=Artemisia annua TaxID=35608 RepID=A0A2U1M8Y7_ARTAN|nr:plant self-incompatibility S1 [Artemisia annua]
MLVFFVIGVLFLNPTFSCAICIGMPKWHMFVTNDMSDAFNMTVRLKDTPAYCSNCPMPPGSVYAWSYCQQWQWWYGDFTWGSRSTTIMLWSKHIYRKCFTFIFPFGTVHCYWSIRPEGFYVSKHNSSFPGPDWNFEGSWPESSIM